MRTSTLLILVIATFAAASADFASFKKMFKLNTAKMVDDSVQWTPAQVDLYVLQFLKGLRADQYVANSTACISATKNLTIALMDTTSAFLNATPADKLNAYFSWTKAVGMISPWMRMCYNSSDGAISAFITHIKSFGSSNVFMQ